LKGVPEGGAAVIVPFRDAVERLIQLGETCPEFREVFDTPRYYPHYDRERFFYPGDGPGTWGQPRELTGEALIKKAECFLRGRIGSEHAERVFIALDQEGKGQYVTWTSDGPRLVYRSRDGSASRTEIPNDLIYLDSVQLELFFGFAAADRKLFLDWELGYWLDGRKPDPVWGWVIKQLPYTSHYDLPKVIEDHRAWIADNLKSIRLIGKLKLYSRESARILAEKAGFDIPPDDSHSMVESCPSQASAAPPALSLPPKEDKRKHGHREKQDEAFRAFCERLGFEKNNKGLYIVEDVKATQQALKAHPSGLFEKGRYWNTKERREIAINPRADDFKPKTKKAKPT
jgi:hypothetical protein